MFGYFFSVSYRFISFSVGVCDVDDVFGLVSVFGLVGVSTDDNDDDDDDYDVADDAVDDDDGAAADCYDVDD